MDDHKSVAIPYLTCSLTRSVTFSFTFLHISGINVSEKYLSDGKLYRGSIEFIRHLKTTRWTMLNGSLSTAIISPRRQWICRALGWSNAYSFPLSNTWAIVGCFLLLTTLGFSLWLFFLHFLESRVLFGVFRHHMFAEATSVVWLCTSSTPRNAFFTNLAASLAFIGSIHNEKLFLWCVQ